ncbi:MAG: twin-arginine translocation signal domain-containing protein [Chloroflexi bacterium]|nr:twin-arginine translocation signal domain-containing protein [Chloroflexota bacterium]
MTDVTPVSRRNFLKTAAGASGAVAVGIFAFPAGLEVVQAIGPGLHRITRTYDRVKIADLGDLV